MPETIIRVPSSAFLGQPKHRSDPHNQLQQQHQPENRFDDVENLAPNRNVNDKNFSGINSNNSSEDTRPPKPLTSTISFSRIRSLGRTRSSSTRPKHECPNSGSPTSVAGLLFSPWGRGNKTGGDSAKSTLDSYSDSEAGGGSAKSMGVSDNTVFVSTSDNNINANENEIIHREIEAIDVSNDEDDTRPLSKEVLDYLSKVSFSKNEVDKILASQKGRLALETREGVLKFEVVEDDDDAIKNYDIEEEEREKLLKEQQATAEIGKGSKFDANKSAGPIFVPTGVKVKQNMEMENHVRSKGRTGHNISKTSNASDKKIMVAVPPYRPKK